MMMDVTRSENYHSVDQSPSIMFKQDLLSFFFGLEGPGQSLVRIALVFR
jgi:hypothetical protein